MKFTKAVRAKAKLRLMLSGPSGSGKTYGALKIAKGLNLGRIAVIDTEQGSASLYADLCEFDTLELQPPYSPERYIEAIRAAESAGYGVIVIDSITHEWNGSGGCLEINDKIASSKFQGNGWAAWNITTPRHRAFVDTILQSPCHVIVTGRSKTETAQSEDAKGKKKIVKLGMKVETRDSAEYDYTVVLDIVHDGHFATASKDRTRLFSAEGEVITEQTGAHLAEWLMSGVDAPVRPAAPAPAPAQEARQQQAPEQPTGSEPPSKADQDRALQLMRDASLEGMKALRTCYGNLAKADKALIETVWREHGASLQAAANSAEAAAKKLNETTTA